MSKRFFQEFVHSLRHQKINEASLSLFAERGCFQFKVEDVANRAGVAKGGIYNHFQSKGEMLRAALEEHQTRAVAEYERRRRDLPEEANPVPKLTLIAEVLLALDCSDKNFFVSAFSRLPCALANMGQGDAPRRVEDLVVSVIEGNGGLEGDGCAGLSHPRFSSTALAELFVGIVIGRPVREVARSAGVPQAAQSAVNFFLRGASLEVE
jgi:AcrR family transcriptional regulator